MPFSTPQMMTVQRNPSEGQARRAATVQHGGGQNTPVPDNETPEGREHVPPVPPFAAQSVPGVCRDSSGGGGDKENDKEGKGGGDSGMVG